MGLLLDTHVLLWWLVDSSDLDGDVKDRLDVDTEVHVSAATVWEIALKHASGRLPGPPDLPERAQDAGFRPLPISASHGAIAGRLPLLHRDPFDRILIAQAQCEGLTLVTHDTAVQRYDVDLLSV